MLAFGRTILVLGLVIGLLLVLARFARRWQVGGGGVRSIARPDARIEVLSRRAFGKHVALVVVQVAHRTFLIGQSVQQITLLAELEGTQWPEAGASAVPVVSDDHLLAPRTALGNGEDSPGAWDAFLDRLREMTVRR